MQNADTYILRSSSGRQTAPVFKVVIAYEDFATARRAQQAFDFLSQNLSHQWQVTSQMWKFELLSPRQLRDMAASDAATADVVMVACHDDSELPPHVRSWIETWTRRRGRIVALVAVLDGTPAQAKGPRSPQPYLEGVAKRAGVEFLAWPRVQLKQLNLLATKRSKAPREAILQAA